MIELLPLFEYYEIWRELCHKRVPLYICSYYIAMYICMHSNSVVFTACYYSENVRLLHCYCICNSRSWVAQIILCFIFVLQLLCVRRMWGEYSPMSALFTSIASSRTSWPECALSRRWTWNWRTLLPRVDKHILVYLRCSMWWTDSWPRSDLLTEICMNQFTCIINFDLQLQCAFISGVHISYSYFWYFLTCKYEITV